MAILKIIYAPNEALLQKYSAESTHWLPENDSCPRPSYQPPEVICTTNNSVIEMIRLMIKAGELASDKVIYIKMESSNNSLLYTFGPDGNINNFFGL